MPSSAGDLSSPRIELVGIELRRCGAEARVGTRAGGQGPLTDTRVLRRVGGRYRNDALR